MAMSQELDLGKLVEELLSGGLLERPSVTPLTGGVSGETVLIEQAPARLVVKRALDRLRVAGDWRAKPERAITEAAAMELLHQLTPAHIPKLRAADPGRNLIVMSAAPAGWVSWKEVLLGEVADPTAGISPTAAKLGELLGLWHDRTWGDARIAARFDDYEAYDQLRIAPFHCAVAAIHRSVADRIGECVRELRTTRECLVHGDFSPKNVLVGKDGIMVLDFEVAHFGAAVFDVAFFQCHLVLKALHMPGRASELGRGAVAFLDAYRRFAGQIPARVGWHTACLLLARVDGLSPASYLCAATAERVRLLALELLAADDPEPAEVWDRVAAVAW